jgi:hypothetical protein
MRGGATALFPSPLVREGAERTLSSKQVARMSEAKSGSPSSHRSIPDFARCTRSSGLRAPSRSRDFDASPILRASAKINKLHVTARMAPMKRNSKRTTVPARAKMAVRKASKPKTTVKPSHAKTSREKVRAHRARMRERGFRLVQMWLPDTRSPQFIKAAHKDSLAIAHSAAEAEDQAFIDSMSWWNSPEAAAFEKTEPPTPWWRANGKPD